MKTWQKNWVKDLCTEIVDCVNKTAPISDVPTPFHMLRTSDVRDGFINLENLNCVSEETFHKWSRRGYLKEGDIVFTREAPLGEAGLVRSAENYFLGQRLVLYRTNPAVCDNHFLLYWFLNPQNKENIKSRGVGATVTHLRVPECEQFEVYAPDVETQKRIGSVLFGYDSLIENNQKQIKLLEEAAQRLYKEWFIDLRFPGHESTPIRDGIPAGWEKVSLADLAPILTGKKDANFGTEDGKYPFFTCAQEPIKAPSYSFDCDAVILAGNGDFNVKLYRGKFEAYQRTYVFSPFEEKHLFLLYHAVRENMRNLFQGASGSTIKFLTKHMLEDISVYLPSESLLKLYNQTSEAVQQKIEVLKAQMLFAQEARDRLLPKLMSGEIEV